MPATERGPARFSTVSGDAALVNSHAAAAIGAG